MLKSVELENIRRHVHTKIELGKLTVLVGPNGSGKSTVLEAISVSQLGSGALPNGEWIRSWRRSGTSTSSISIGTHQGVFKLSSPHTPDVDGSSAPPFAVVDLQLDPTRMRARCDLSEAELASDGHNIAAVIADLILARDGRIDEIERALVDLVPGVTRLTAARIGHHVQIVVDFEGVGPLRGDQLSEGTLLAAGLLTALASVQGPTVLLIDDVDRGLHMDAQHELIGILKRAVETRPDLQIVLTTHSPFILEGVDASDIVLFGLDEHGACITGRLQQHPDAEQLLKLLSPAEMWTSVAEGWLTRHSAK